MEKKKKEQWGYVGAVVVILIISLACGFSGIDLGEEFTKFFKGIWTGTQEAVDQSFRVEKLADGAHVDIMSTDVVYVREIYEVLGETVDEEQAVAILEEVKTLAYHGKDIGIAASSKEKDAFVDDLKEQMKDADESQYNRMVRRYGDEKDYWTVLDDAIEEYVIAEKVKSEKRKELEDKIDVEVEKELQEYIDKLVGYEKFQYKKK